MNADLPDSYIFADDIESPVGAKLPLWMLGFCISRENHGWRICKSAGTEECSAKKNGLQALQNLHFTVIYSANNSSIFLIKFLEGTVIVSISSSVMA